MVVVEAPQWHTELVEKSQELKRDYYARILERAWQGRPVAWCTAGVSTEVLDCMDMAAAFPESLAGEACLSHSGMPFLERAEGEGFPPDMCSHMRIGLGYAAMVKSAEGLPVNAPLGGLPRPQMYLATSRLCDPRMKFVEALRRYFDVPTYAYEQLCAPADIDCTNRRALEHYVEYNARQLREFIQFLEKHTGTKLDRERLRQAVKNSIEVRRLLNAILELRKAIPSPLPTGDLWMITWPWNWMPSRDETVAFYRQLYAEVKERVARGEGTVPEERFRLLWACASLRMDMAFYNYGEPRGAVFVMEAAMEPPPSVDIDLSDPVRALAEHSFYNTGFSNSDGTEVRYAVVGGNILLRQIREYQVDGVVLYVCRSCRQVTIGTKHMARRLRELDIPVLEIEGDMSDPRAYSPIKAREDFDTFLEMLSSQKKPRAN